MSLLTTCRHGSLRGQEEHVENFTKFLEATPEHQAKGWPWKKPKIGNDPDVVIIDEKYSFLKTQRQNCLTDEGRQARELKRKRETDRESEGFIRLCDGTYYSEVW